MADEARQVYLPPTCHGTVHIWAVEDPLPNERCQCGRAVYSPPK